MDGEISVSMGISVCPRDGKDFESLYESADRALYQVKRNGKGNYRLFAEETEDK